MTTVTISGLPEIDARLQYLGDKSARKIGRAAARKMVAVYAKSIRRFVPKSIAPRVPDVGIGSRGVRSRGSRIYAAKAGIGVGGAGKNKAGTVVNRGKRKGVGVSAKNLHWFALGTADRRTKGKRFTGRIDPRKFGGFVQKGVLAVELQAIAEGQKVVDKMIEKEVQVARSGA